MTRDHVESNQGAHEPILAPLPTEGSDMNEAILGISSF